MPLMLPQCLHTAELKIKGRRFCVFLYFFLDPQFSTSTTIVVSAVKETRDLGKSEGFECGFRNWKTHIAVPGQVCM
jgi:hypothetical protein